MRIFLITLALVVSLYLQNSMADSFALNELANKQCDAIANACKNAGFIDESTGAKSFWFACMKPVLYGKSVNGVTINQQDIQGCRAAKIAKLKQEINELEAVK